MRALILSVIFCTLLLNAHAQSSTELDHLLSSGKQMPKILLVGTFHFGYPGLDSHKTAEAYQIDICSPQKQEEVRELVDYLSRYQPKKILVERDADTEGLMSQYREWQAGKADLRKEEIDQVGFRLMDRFELDTLYGVDATSLYGQLAWSADSIHARPILDRIYAEKPDSLFESETDDKYWEWYELRDQRCIELPLLDYFKEINSLSHVSRSHGHYVLRDGDDSYDGVDGLTISWYSRNLRILKNIHMIETEPEERLLLLIGSGHLPILRQQLDASPEYDLIEFGALRSWHEGKHHKR